MPGGHQPNAVFWDRLLGFVEERKVIPVVGPELSTIELDGATVPLHLYLAERLAEYLGMEPAEGGARDLNEVVCRYLSEHRGDLQDIYAGLKVVMPPDDELPVPAALTKLAEIEPFRLFVSTTFDTLLERAVNAARCNGRPCVEVHTYSPQRIEDIPSELPRLTAPVVFHLMGRISASPEYAVTEEDTLEFLHALQSESRRPRLLFDELTRNHLLILGSSLSEWLARFFIRIAKRERLWLARLKTDIVVDGRASHSESLMRFLRHFNEQTKVVPQATAGDFVDELHRRWTERAARAKRPEQPADQPEAGATMEPGAVFLSYATEDIERVRSLHVALEAAGIPVWFDKSPLRGLGADERRLRAGDAFESRIRQSIERAAVFVPIISRNTLTPKPRFFRLEWTHAEHVADQLPRGARFIVPIAVDDTPVDDDHMPPRFRALHWIRLAEGAPPDDLVRDLRELVREHHRAHLAGPA